MSQKPIQTDDISVLKEENKRLRRAVDELSIVNDIAMAIGASVNSESIMRTIIRRTLRAVNAEEGAITLFDESDDAGMKTLVRTMVRSNDGEPFHVHQNLLGWMQINKKPLLMNDVQSDPRFRGVKWDRAIRSVLCMPLMVKSKLIGVLTVYNKKHFEAFNSEDKRLTAIIAAQSAQVIENARLYEEEQAFMLLQQELSVASKIQRDLLPRESPALEGYEIAGRSIPAQTVGGDYFDFMRKDEKQLVFCVGDVAGKGLSASLLMANLQATLRGQITSSQSPRDCLNKANRLLYHSTSADRFVTLFIGSIDMKKSILRYCNAGHDFPFHISSAGEVNRLQTGDCILGIMDSYEYSDKSILINPGDIIVVSSDGISEAVNERNEHFGEERLERVLLAHRHESPSVIIDSVVSEVERHRGKAARGDDVTLVVLKKN